ncbi:hypothetical protein BH23BAC1_BH23BAC1_42080 [soil metagenome]
MDIGDKVRLLRGSEEGTISRFLDQNLVEIEIEDGFKIPVLRNEVVVIAKEEAVHFKGATFTNTEKLPEVAKGSSQEGIFLAFVEINDKILSGHLINNTSFDILFVLFEEGKNVVGRASGELSAYKTIKVLERNLVDFDHWPLIILQLLYFKRGEFILKEPLQKIIKFKAGSFFKGKKPAPLLSQNAFLFNLETDHKLSADSVEKVIDPQALKEQMFDRSSGGLVQKDRKTTLAPDVVDLHIEKLIDDHQNMKNSEILELQLKTFEKFMDQALVSGLNEITFIHGAGNGVLKNAIHKKLSKMPEIKFFQDAQKEKFGYGATLVGLK